MGDGTKHKNRSWLTGDINSRWISQVVRPCPREARARDHSKLPGDVKFAWQYVLEQAVRKKAYNWVRLEEVDTITEGIAKAFRYPEILNLHFVIPLTTTAAGPAWPHRRRRSHKRPDGAEDGSPMKKAKKGLMVKSPDGKPISFKLNNNVSFHTCVIGLYSLTSI